MINGGLVLEGGGMRGVYTAGILDALMDAGLYFSHNYGVSAGACHACSYLSRQRGRAFRTVTDYLRDRRYAGVHSLLTSGDFFGVQMIYDEIPNRLIPFDYETFTAKEERLWAVLTDCRTGQAAYRQVGNLRYDIDVIRASSSLPLLSRMVDLGGIPYLDGGISDSIPLARSMEDGNTRHLVILTQHKGYRKEANSMMPLVRAKYRKWPKLVESIATRHERYNAALRLVNQEQAEGRAFVIQPARPVEIGRLEKNRAKLDALYRQGVEDAEENVTAMRIFFGLA